MGNKEVNMLNQNMPTNQSIIIWKIACCLTLHVLW